MPSRGALPAASIIVLALILGACGSPGSDPGVAPVVTNLADEGPGSLRAALAVARSGQVVRFETTGTITLTRPLVIERDVTVEAPANTSVVLIGGPHRVVEVRPGVSLTLSRLTLDGGATVRPPQEPSARLGGVVVNAGTLVLDDTNVTNGRAMGGGGIHNQQGATLHLKGGRVDNNAAQAITGENDVSNGAAGGILNEGTLLVTGGTVTNNTSVFLGGGILNTVSGTLTLRDGRIESNRCTDPLRIENGVEVGCVGGGIHTNGGFRMEGGVIGRNASALAGGGVMHVQPEGTSSTFLMSGGRIENNQTDAAGNVGGGGVWSNGTFRMTGGTLAGNSSQYGGGLSTRGLAELQGGSIEGNSAIDAGGGVIVSHGGQVVLDGTTVRGNVVTTGGLNDSGGGGLTVSEDGTLVVRSGTVSGNTSPLGGGLRSWRGTLDIRGGTISDNTATLTGGGVQADDASTVRFSDGTISNNSARTGAGVYLSGNSTMTVSGTARISTNRTVVPTGQTGAGGGFYVNGSTVSFSGGSVETNSADFGGGFDLHGTASLQLQGGAVNGNTATVSGGGIRVNAPARLERTGGSVSGNTPDNVVGGP